ncbi:YbhB/YbcL family Raf kinase inhibitor-like protein [Altererythrobacter sp. KTW20L]|uniref:YbhB/YbcL family Raf kinase inhibitor-like protein n=1 Tax=Altererythrobacter sp. KTW20L TaxID=2942210 RepID=UPI0020BF4FBF|nr:YbhB/YbcL family Raf kinase inhibitor-like protein [Altererythrobacter sp. KTW20L]MCL6250508.1 YbhB/YbcL family Raf kinase inhibitor-like protein [Altererythrobacter sp. KTW20L]
MSDVVPQWLAKALHNPRPGHAGLVVARLAAAGEITEGMLGKGGLKLTSAAFADGEALDPSFTADEEDSVAPPLEWTAPPPGTFELVLIVEDPDAVAAKDGAPFCHWAVWGLAGQRGKLLEGEVPPRVGKNSFGNSEWLLPDPPTGADPHDYLFQLFALDLPLTLMPGASREELVEAIRGHVTSVALLTGTYAREEGGDYDFEDEDED